MDGRRLGSRGSSHEPHDYGSCPCRAACLQPSMPHASCHPCLLPSMPHASCHPCLLPSMPPCGMPPVRGHAYGSHGLLPRDRTGVMVWHGVAGCKCIPATRRPGRRRPGEAMPACDTVPAVTHAMATLPSCTHLPNPIPATRRIHP